MSDLKRAIQFGDIIQITQDAKVIDPLKGTLAIVESVREWGVIAMVDAVGSKQVFAVNPPGYAFVRLQWGSFYYTGGKAEVFKWVPNREKKHA